MSATTHQQFPSFDPHHKSWMAVSVEGTDARSATTGVVLVGRSGGLRNEFARYLRAAAPVVAELEHPRQLAALAPAPAGSRPLDGIAVVVLTEPFLPGLTTRLRHRHRFRMFTAECIGLATAAADLGAQRLVVCSSAFLYADDGGHPLHVLSNIEPGAETVAAHAAERAAQYFTARGGRSVVLRFGWVFSDHDPITARVVAAARKGWRLIDGHPGAWVPAVALPDAATAILTGITAPAGTYNVSDGRPVTQAAINAVLEEAADIRLHPLDDARWGEGGILFGSSRLLADPRFSDLTGWRPVGSDLRRHLFHRVRAVRTRRSHAAPALGDQNSE